MKTTRMIMGAAAAAALAAAMPAAAQRQVEARQATGATGRVEVTLQAGSLRVIGWNRNEVQVTGQVQRATDRVQIEGGQGTVEIEVVGSRGRPGHASLEIRVPAGKSVELVTRGGPLHVSGITGDVEATNQGGPVTIEGSPRDVEVMSQGGPVNVNATAREVAVHSAGGPVTIAGAVRGGVEIDAMSGPVTVTAAAARLEVNSLSGGVRATSVNGEAEITSVSGPVHLAGRGLSGSVESVSGDVVVEGTLSGPLGIQSHSGNVELRLPASTAADVEITTYSGGFRSDFGPGRRDGGERRVRLGRGGTDVSITTFSGHVKLTRR